MASTSNNPDLKVERRCENADCLVGDLVSRIPKRKTPQFIVNPTIIEKPLLVNNFNSVFQVDGVSAKLSDIQSNTSTPGAPNTIYRIIPNTHAHIVNYVVVDDDGDSMRKLNSSDPATITKLLRSQVASAQKMLHKLMTEQGTMVNVSYNNKSGSGPKELQQTPTSAPAPPTALTAAILAHAEAENENLTFQKSTNLKTYVAKSTVLELPKTTTITPVGSAVVANPIVKNPNQMISTSTTSTTTSMTIVRLPTKSTTATTISLKPGNITKLPTTVSQMPTSEAATTTTVADLSKSFRLSSSIKVTRKILPKAGSASGGTTTTATATTTITASKNNTISTPLIKTVPLSQLQKPSVLQNRPFTTTIKPLRSSMPNYKKTSITLNTSNSSINLPSTSFQALSSASSSSTLSANLPLEYPPPTARSDVPDEPISMEEMKKELEELRRSVAVLAANQAISVGAVATIAQVAPTTPTLTTAAAPLQLQVPVAVAALPIPLPVAAAAVAATSISTPGNKSAATATVQQRAKRARLEK